MQYLNAKNVSYGISAGLDIGLTATGAAFLTSMNPFVGALFAPLHTVITYVALAAISKCVDSETLEQNKTKILLGTSVAAAVITAGITFGALALFGVAFSFVSLAVMLLALIASALAFTLFHLAIKSDVLEGSKAPETRVVYVSRPEDSTDYYQQVYIVDENNQLVEDKKNPLPRPEARRVVQKLAQPDRQPWQNELKIGGEVLFKGEDPAKIVIDEREEDLDLPPLPAPIVYRRVRKKVETVEGNTRNISYVQEDVKLSGEEAKAIVAELQGE